MFKALIFIGMLLFPIEAIAQVKVKGYTKKNGTYVEPYERSKPNAYKWDNTGYKPSQDPYNSSYTSPKKNYGSDWATPNPNRFSDNNPNNDYPPTSPPSYQDFSYKGKKKK